MIGVIAKREILESLKSAKFLVGLLVALAIGTAAKLAGKTIGPKRFRRAPGLEHRPDRFGLRRFRAVGRPVRGRGTGRAEP